MTPMTSMTSSRNARVLRSVILIVVLLGAGLLIAGVLTALRVRPERRLLTTLPPLVETVTINVQDVAERFVGYGTARATRSAKITAEVAATVVGRERGMRAGSIVIAGQILVRLDDREYRHFHDRAQALVDADQAAITELQVDAQNIEQLSNTAEQELHVARDEKRRLAKLLERALASTKEYDFANLAYQRARRLLQGYQRESNTIAPRQQRLLATKRVHEADAAIAQMNIERCTIRAPFDGRIQDFLVDVGDHVGPGTVMLTLLDASRVEIPIRLPVSTYGRVKIGAACRVASEVAGSNAWEGRIIRIAPAADEQTRTFEAYVVVDNRTRPGVGLVPGAFVRAEVQGAVYEHAILVPRGACRDGRVYVAQDNVARARRVTTVTFMEDQALVRGDLAGGDRVIISHLGKLADGSPVRVREQRSADSTPKAGRTGTGVSLP